MRLKSALLIASGMALLALGVIGIAVPVLPTTPFVLGAVGCLSCAPRLRERILKVPFIRQHYDNYRERRGLPRRTAALSLGYLWGMLALSAILTRRAWLAAVLAAVGIAVTAHILLMSKPGRK